MNFCYMDEVLYAEAVRAALRVTHMQQPWHMPGDMPSSPRRRFMIDAGGEIHHVFESIDEEEAQTWQWLEQGLFLKSIELTVPQWLRHGLVLKLRLKRWFMMWQWTWLRWMWRTACDVEAGREPGCNPIRLETVVEDSDEEDEDEECREPEESRFPPPLTVTEYYKLDSDVSRSELAEASQRPTDSSLQGDGHVRWAERWASSQ